MQLLAPLSVTQEASVSGGSAGLRSACLRLGNVMPSGCLVRLPHVRDLLPQHLLPPDLCCSIRLVRPRLLPSHVPWSGCRKRPRCGERRRTSCLLSGGGCRLSAPLLSTAHLPEPGTSPPVDRAFSGHFPDQDHWARRMELTVHESLSLSLSSLGLHGVELPSRPWFPVLRHACV